MRAAGMDGLAFACWTRNVAQAVLYQGKLGKFSQIGGLRGCNWPWLGPPASRPAAAIWVLTSVRGDAPRSPVLP